MKQPTSQQAVAKYYSRIGSRLGYGLVLKRSQHFGYYDADTKSEDVAQLQYHQKFSELLDLSSGMKVLDAGCGQGVVACYMAKNFKVSVTGITVVPHEVRNATKCAKTTGVEQSTEFILADYANPPFKPGTFDRIYTTETLSHAVDLQKVLEVFWTLLKPGGKLVCAEYEFDYSQFGEREHAAAKFTKDYAAIHGIYQFDKDEFPKRLQRLGFKQIESLDWSEYVAPSFARLERIAHPVAKFAKTFHIEKYFVNSVSAEMYTKSFAEKKFAYKVYSAVKP